MIRKITLLSIIISLVVSCAVPIGTAFAFDDAQPVEVITELSDDTTLLEGKGEGGPPQNVVQVTDEDATSQEAPVVSLEEVPIVKSAEKHNDTLQQNELSLADDTLPQAVPVDGIVISRVQATGGTGKTDEELIELYNNTAESIDITGWCLESYKQSKPTTALSIGCIAPSAGVGWRVLLPARTAYVFTSGAFNAANKDAGGHDFIPDQIIVTAGVFNNDTGRAVLRDGGGSVHDAVTWGDESELIVDQGATRALISKPAYTLERRFNEATFVFQDTDDNVVDFLTGTTRPLYTTGGALDLYDACLNILGIQSSEEELYRDELTGECTDALPLINTCNGLLLSEIAANVEEQFIEVYNNTDASLSLEGCQLQTNRSDKTFIFNQLVTLDAGASLTVLVADSDLLLTKTTSGTVYLLSSNGETEVDSTSYSGLAKETSWALIDGTWKQTFTLTPATQNVYAQYPPCDNGYSRNLETGRCNKDEESVQLADCGEGRERNPTSGRCRAILAIQSLVPCREGQYRSEETNRCRSIAIAAAAVLKPCADDQFRNPLTNRCKKIASSEDIALADCGEGRERNPLTNRCRNILTSTQSAQTLPFPVEKVKEGTEQFARWWTLAVVVMTGLGYAVWEWRGEIAQGGRRIHQFLRRSK